MVFLRRFLKTPIYRRCLGAGSQVLPASRRCFSSESMSLQELFRRVEQGSLSAKEAAELHTSFIQEDIDNDETLKSFANLDLNRTARSGFPEAVFAENKTAPQVAAILDDMARNVKELMENGADVDEVSSSILATRVTREMQDELNNFAFKHGSIEYNDVARIVKMKANALVESDSERRTIGRVIVATAGSTDIPVAEEAAVTLGTASCDVDRVYDVGVAGLHRIIRALPRLRHPNVGCVIVCAGMDGALPSVVGGLVSVPVIAVPTGIGYGASFGGISALLTMLNSCSPGVCVMNIDNGFGAAAFALKCIRPLSNSRGQP